MLRSVPVIILSAGLLTACNRSDAQDAAAAPTPLAAPQSSVTTVAAAQAAAPVGFDPASVPESTAALPPFPMFKPLTGLESVVGGSERTREFDVDYFVAGSALVAVEGRVYRDIFPLQGARPYSALEFQRNYEQAITALGGVKIAGPVQTEAFFSQRPEQPTPNGSCFQFSCDANFYLIRQGGRELWISVGTASIPLHGYVTVAERKAMAQSFSFLNADALKAALDANGHVPVYIEFDVDRATLRPNARPAVDEIVKLMRAHPDLRISIEGHTDDTGTAARNRVLSQERADAVRAALIAANVAAGRMRTAGFGADRPLATNTSDANRARNRRVELVRIA